MKGASPVFGATARPAPRGPTSRGLDRWLLPEEGWTAFLALALMLATVGVAIDDATWAGFVAGTRITQTSFLAFGAVLAVAVGLVLAKSSLSRFRAHLLGAMVAAVYLLNALGSVVSDAPGLVERLRALNLSVATFFNDVLVNGGRSTETSVFLLTLGALLWAAGQFGAFSVFRYQRALPAIAIAAVPLLINVLLTVRGQYLHVVVFAAAALLLLVRMNLLRQVLSWRARAIGEGAQVSGAFLRAGTVFIALALVGSVTLAANTSSAPLSAAWRNVDERLVEWGYDVNRWMGGVSGPARGPNLLFAPSQTIRDLWESSDAIEFTAVTSDGNGYRWRGSAYDSFDGRTWHQSRPTTTYRVPAGEDVLAGTAEGPAAQAGRREVLVEVIPEAIAGHVFVAPEAPHVLSHETEIQVHVEDDGSVGGFARGLLPGGLAQGSGYTVRAQIRATSGAGALTANQLAAAGVGYPRWVERYMTVQEGSVGEETQRTAEQIVRTLAPDKRDPYHVAEAMQAYLRSSRFTYRTDVRGYCTGRNLVDCFLSRGMRTGYCEYFASAMVMMLRTQQIPARYVVGYLPGKQRLDGIWDVPRNAAHAWVEVYFPGHGWVTFDPTPGNTENGNQLEELPEGEVVATPPPPEAPQPTPYFIENPREGPLERPPLNPSSGAGGGGGWAEPLMLLAAVGLGLALLLVVASARIRRLPATDPELAYRGVARLAARFGHGPKPTQTPYEFSDRLGRLLPSVREEVQLVATAKVETTYGARRLPGDVLQDLRRAYARVRIGLLRLLWQRPRRRRGRA